MSFVTSRKALCAVGLVLVLASIAGARESKIDPDFVASRATAVVHRIVQGLSEGDYSLFTQDFSKAMKDAQTRDSFLNLQRKLQKSLGKFQSLEYLGYYEQYGGIITLFKARFRKEKEDVLIKVVLDGKKAEPQVTGLWFESPSLEK